MLRSGSKPSVVLLAALFLAAALCTRPCRAAGPLGPDGSPVATSDFTIDVFGGPVLGGSRMTGLGGAYTAIAEGTDGNLQNPVDSVLDHYYAHCAIEASCRDLALAGLFLSKHGLRVDGRRLLGRTDAKRMNAVMLTCGTYDAAGEFAYRVGLPAKSGVGGGVLAVIPQHGTLCAWGPRLDAAGNSVSAIAALDQFTTATGLSVF